LDPYLVGSLVPDPWSKTEKLYTKKKRKITVSEQDVGKPS
jgi:hypothetical protein